MERTGSPMGVLNNFQKEIAFAELCAKTNYSFLEGASSPEEMVGTAYSLGYHALGITDHNGVYGIPRAHSAAKLLSFPLIVGSEVELPEKTSVTLLSLNRNGYGNLCELLTHAHRDNERGFTATSLESISSYQKDLYCLASVSTSIEIVDSLHSLFGDRLSISVSFPIDGRDKENYKKALSLSEKTQIPCVATNLPLFHSPKRKPLQDVLTSIKELTPINKAGFKLLPNAERFLKPKVELLSLFKDNPEWIHQSVLIANQCQFSLSEIKYHYPNEWIPTEHTNHSYLEHLVWEGAHTRYGNSIPEPFVKQINHELSLIEDLDYADYFLTTWDIVRWARQQNILCQGRGSAANSLVCYVLGITSIDPIRMDLLFERFLSRERKEPPDIDIDFEHERREEVIQYIYNKYGRHRAAICAEVICFRKRSALREVAKVFEIPESTVKNVTALTTKRSLSTVKKEEYVQVGVPSELVSHYFSLVHEIQGFPRHLGTHVGGFVLSHEPLCRNVPIENAAMPNRSIIQWDKNDLDTLNFVKVDILGLGMMTCLRKAFDYLKSTYQITTSLSELPAEDPKVYEMIQKGDTIGVFQIESRAQMSMLPRLKPKNFFDLVVEISLVRPGPIQGQMVHPYLRRRAGIEPVTYAHPLLEKILKKTFGVPLFQEQIMKMAIEVADFTPGEADELRRAMGTWKISGTDRLSRMGERFCSGLLKKGIAKEFADQIFSQIQGFAEYGFPESHAASFAILAYASAYLKLYYPDVFLASLLNSQPMGFYQPHTLIHDAERHGVLVQPIDISYSNWDAYVEAPKIVRLGFREVHALPKKLGLILETLRRHVKYQSIEHFVVALEERYLPNILTKRDLFTLAMANAFRSLGLCRREALWKIQGLSLRDALPHGDENVSLPLENPKEAVFLDYESTGLSLGDHPMDLFAAELKAKKVVSSKEIKDKKGKRITVAGIVISRQMPPTASGVLFITLEDQFGFSNLVIWNKVYQQYREVLLKHSFLVVRGKIEKAVDGEVYHVIVEHAEALLTDTLSLTSHDFH